MDVNHPKSGLPHLPHKGSMAVIVYVSIFPQLFLICVHMPISGLPLCCTSMYMPNARVSVCTVRQPAYRKCNGHACPG